MKIGGYSHERADGKKKIGKRKKQRIVRWADLWAEILGLF